MALNVNDFIASFKKQTYISLIQNMNIRFPNIKNTILQYAKSQSTGLYSLLDLYNIDLTYLSSSTVNATILLAYLDFYSLYTVLYSIYNNYQGFLDTSKNKYLYIDNLYKNMESILVEKEESKYNKYITYINFENKNSVQLYKNDILSRTGSIDKQLDFTDTLSLPINNSKVIYPSTIIPEDKDVTGNTVILDKGKDYIYYDIVRSQNDYIGIVKSIVPTNNFVSKSNKVEIAGSITDISVDNIYINITSINNNVATVSCSFTGTEWSSSSTIVSRSSIPLLIEDDIDTGLTLTITYDNTLKVNDSWIANVSNIQLPYPSANIKLKFDKFDNISYLSFDDISPYKLSLDDMSSKTTRFGNLEDQMIYNKQINKFIIFHNSQLNECNLSFSQKDSTLFNDSGKISYKHSFYLNNIQAVSNEYIPHGSISFNKLDVKDISNITIVANEQIPNSNSFIEYNIYAETDTDKLLIPCLRYNQTSVNEYIIPTQIDDSGVTYKTRFPVNTLSPIVIKDLSTGNTYNVLVNGQDPNNYYDVLDKYYLDITMKQYDSSKEYSISYTPLIVKSTDTYDLNSVYWIKKNKLMFMYYKDTDLSVKLAIENIDTKGDINLFSGTVSSFIEQRSTDQQFVSPYITTYEVKYN